MSAPVLRCAVYTRKSSEDGLDQAFNSLHAQRDACEAFVLSQIGEGWILLPEVYDDGGWSGGNMERPALKRLLDDVKAGRVDTIVVYKVDRLTRSLGDFARIIEILDAAKASFVSVTQAFNTTTSMGRLTLNVLLSFAQFEREVTGERIRDKIAASKAKGIWMGGVLPLGYDTRDRLLKINPAEAEQVRHIFRRYLALGSVHVLAHELARDGIHSKRRVTRKGIKSGGGVLVRGALFHLLQNRTYLGEIVHKDQSFPGQHPAIVDRDLFDAVQALLADNRIKRATQPLRSDPAMLTGRLFSSDGRPMSPAFAYGKKGVQYRYYVAAALQRGEMLDRGMTTDPAKAPLRVPVKNTEAWLLDHLARWSGKDGADWKTLLPLVRRVELGADTVQVVIDGKQLAGKGNCKLAYHELQGRLADAERLFIDEDGRSARIWIPERLQFRGGRTWRQRPSYGAASGHADKTLIEGLKRAHTIAEEYGISPIAGSARNARAPADPYKRRLCRMVFLAGDIQDAILAGRQPYELTLSRIIDEPPPTCWREQRKAFGFPARRGAKNGFRTAAAPSLTPSARAAETAPLSALQ